MKQFKKFMILIGVLTCALLIGCDSWISCNFYSGGTKKQPKISTTVVSESVNTKRYGTDFTSGTDNCWGTVTLTEDSVHMDGLMPGDGISFEISIENKNDKDIDLRTMFTVEGELVPALIIKVDGVVLSASTDWTAWTKMAVGETAKTISVSIEFDVNAGNEYSDKSADITFTVEAVESEEAEEPETPETPEDPETPENPGDGE